MGTKAAIIGSVCLPIHFYFLMHNINNGIAYDAVLPIVGIMGGLVAILSVGIK